MGRAPARRGGPCHERSDKTEILREPVLSEESLEPPETGKDWIALRGAKLQQMET